MKRIHALWVLPLLMAALFVGCSEDSAPGTASKEKVPFTPQGNVTVAGERLSGVAVFEGDTHFELTDNLNLISDLKLTAADFTVTGDGAISLIYVGYDEIKVTLTFTANPSFTESRVFTVKIAQNSAVIKGDGAVTITQSPKIKLALTADSALNVVATATTAKARFRSADDLTGLTANDFTATAGASVTGVTVTGDIASGYMADVAVSFTENQSLDDMKTYVVGIADASAMITGTATVSITQNRKESVINLSPATLSISQDYEGANTSATWTLSGSHSQTLMADPENSANKVGRYSASGSGNRSSTITFVPSSTGITGDQILIEFDWYPGTYNGGNNNRGPVFLAFLDSGSRKIITFLNEHESTLKFRLGNFADSLSSYDSYFDGTFGIPGTDVKTKWYKFRVIINFATGRLIRIFVYDKATGAELFKANDLDLVGASTYTHVIKTLSIYQNRTDGGNTFYLDNVFVGNGEKP